MRKRPEDTVGLIGFLAYGYANGRVPYDQLQEQAMGRPCEAEEQIDRCTRSFLLCMIGSSMLAAIRKRVDQHILGPLCDVDAISRYDWGGAALFTLYANLYPLCQARPWWPFIAFLMLGFTIDLHVT